MTRAERRKQWRTIIDNQATSGMSIAAYCREHHLTSSYYYTWRRKLRAEQSATGGFLELIPGKPVEAASGVPIGLGAKLAIEVTRGFDPYTLRAVVETLKDLSRCSA